MVDVRIPARGERWRLKPGVTAASPQVVTIDGTRTDTFGEQFVTWRAQLRPQASILGGDTVTQFLQQYEPDEGPR